MFSQLRVAKLNTAKADPILADGAFQEANFVKTKLLQDLKNSFGRSKFP